MDENPPRSRRKKRTHKTEPPRSLSLRSESSSSSSTLTTQSSSRNHGRFTRTEEEEAGECSGESCRACSATLVADCVALCCCPLAVVSLLALAFIKVPYAMGRRCLARKKRKNKEKRKLCVSRKDSVRFGCNGCNSDVFVDGSRDIVFEFGENDMVEQRRSLCTGFIEVDNVLLELYQVGHLGFGRVSFTGIQPDGKGN